MTLPPNKIVALTEYLQGQALPSLFTSSSFTLHLSQFSFGQSNPTYLCTATYASAAPTKFVLRRKPNHAIDKTAHAIEREFHVLSHLKATSPDVPVPEPYHLCSDAGVIGSPFFLMEFVPGRIFKDPSLKSVPAASRREYYSEAVRVLRLIHSAPATTSSEVYSGVPSSAPPRAQTPFLLRQIRKLLSVSALQSRSASPVPNLSELSSTLLAYAASAPGPALESERPRIIHGDYKLDNLIFHPTLPVVVAVLDWELSTLGDPYCDLGTLQMVYHIPAADEGDRDAELVGLSGLDLEVSEGS